MSTSQIVAQQIQVTGSLLSLNVFQEKLMRNFYIINSKLRRLDELQELDIKIKALEKEQKFMNSKMDSMQEKLPKDGSLTRNDVKIIAKDQVFQIFNSKDQRVTNSKFFQDLLKQVHSIRVDIARIRVQGPDSGNQQGQKSNVQGSSTNRASFTAAQVFMQQGKKSVTNRDSLQDVLDKTQMGMVEGIMSEEDNINPVLKQINTKFEDLYRQVEQIRLGKIFNDFGDKDINKFQKYEHYQQKTQQTARKIKDKGLRLDGIKNQNVKGQILKNDLYSQYQKAELVRNQMNRTETKIDGKKSLKGLLANTTQKKDIRIIDNNSDSKVQRSKPSKSLKKLEKIERRLKVDDIKDINSVLREIQLRIQGRVTHEIFMGFIEDIQQKIEILRITKDSTNQLSELRKMLYGLQTRVQTIITFIQNSNTQDNALFVKKGWACVSCDKNIQKYGAKTGQHLNWDNLGSKKISPSKLGAFGQTGQLASKIKSLLENQKMLEQ